MRTRNIVTTLAAIAIAPLVLFGSGAANAQTMNGNQQTAQPSYSSTTNTPNTTNNTPNYSTDDTMPSNMSNSTSSTTGSMMNSSKLTGIYRVGSRGQNVKTLQSFLQKQGNYKGAIDGIYGPRTRMAVRTFQRKHSLVADGIVGLSTEDVIYQMQST